MENGPSPKEMGIDTTSQTESHRTKAMTELEQALRNDGINLRGGELAEEFREAEQQITSGEKDEVELKWKGKTSEQKVVISRNENGEMSYDLTAGIEDKR